MLQTLGWILAFREWIEVRQKPHGSAFGHGANLNHLVLVINEPREKAGDAPELLQRVRKITVRNPEITSLSGAVNLAGNPVSQLFVFFAFLRPKHLLNRVLEGIQAGFN